MAAAKPVVVLHGGDLGGTEVSFTITEWPLGELKTFDGGLAYRRDETNMAVFTGMV